jgi:iron(III) transport system ATP-binding protein
VKGLHIHGVSHAFDGLRILNNVSFTVPAGELVCLLGPSGSGKSTLLRIAAGLERLQEGRVIIDDEVVADPSSQVAPEHRRIGLMFQDYALFPHLNVLDNVTFGLPAAKSATARARALDLLEQVGMTDHIEKYPHMLSGGQQQRVALARALAPKPRLLLLDEPFSGLDTSMRAVIRKETVSVLRDSGVATLMITHDPEEAMYMADRIKILGNGGRVLQQGTPSEIYYHPVDEFVATLFGPVNRFEGIVTAGAVESPLGRIDTAGMDEGSKVDVLIRPEGLMLGTENGAHGGVPVEVLSTRLLGNSNSILLKRAGEDGPEFQARVTEDFDPFEVGPILARIDARHAFVYRKEEAEPGPGPVCSQVKYGTTADQGGKA